MNTKELAKILNVSSTAILEHYKKNSKAIGNHVKKIKNERKFDKTAQTIIANSFKTRIRNTRQIDVLTLQSYKARIADLKQEVSHQYKNINHLQKLLNHQQELQLNSQQELKETKNQLKLNSKNNNHGKIWKFFHNL